MAQRATTLNILRSLRTGKVARVKGKIDIQENPKRKSVVVCKALRGKVFNRTLNLRQSYTGVAQNQNLNILEWSSQNPDMRICGKT